MRPPAFLCEMKGDKNVEYLTPVGLSAELELSLQSFHVSGHVGLVLSQSPVPFLQTGHPKQQLVRRPLVPVLLLLQLPEYPEQIVSQHLLLG